MRQVDICRGNFGRIVRGLSVQAYRDIDTSLRNGGRDGSHVRESEDVARRKLYGKNYGTIFVTEEHMIDTVLINVIIMLLCFACAICILHFIFHNIAIFFHNVNIFLRFSNNRRGK